MLGRIVTPADVRAARARLGWSIKHLAEASGVGYSSISGYESGKVNISVLTLVAICEAINMHSSDPTVGVSSNSEITRWSGTDRGGDAICNRCTARGFLDTDLRYAAIGIHSAFQALRA